MHRFHNPLRFSQWSMSMPHLHIWVYKLDRPSCNSILQRHTCLIYIHIWQALWLLYVQVVVLLLQGHTDCLLQPTENLSEVLILGWHNQDCTKLVPGMMHAGCLPTWESMPAGPDPTAGTPVLTSAYLRIRLGKASQHKAGVTLPSGYVHTQVLRPASLLCWDLRTWESAYARHPCLIENRRLQGSDPTASAPA
jgi:hypothetical protein